MLQKIVGLLEVVCVDKSKGRGKEEAEEIRAHPAPTSFLKIQTRLRACCGFNLGTPRAAASRRTGLALLLLMAGWLVTFLKGQPRPSMRDGSVADWLAGRLLGGNNLRELLH